MGFKKDAAPVVDKPAETPAPATPAQTPDTAAYAKLAAKAAAEAMAPEEKKVRGQVRMHGIITGYKVAAQLAPTLANTAAGIKDELHKLATEVAAKVEAYSFGEE